MSGLRPGDTAAVVAAAREALASYRAGRMLARHHDALERAIDALVVERGRCAWNAIPVPGAPTQERCAASCAKACAHDDPCFCAAHDPYPGVRPSDPQPARLETVAQLARDILTAIESHDTHRMRHIEQYALRIIRVAEGTQT